MNRRVLMRTGETHPSRINDTEGTLPPFLSPPRSAYRRPRKHFDCSVAPVVVFSWIPLPRRLSDVVGGYFIPRFERFANL
jgi:hypothetical protein